MQTPMAYIESMGITTTSAIRAIREISDWPLRSKQFYSDSLKFLVGIENDLDYDEKYLNVLFKYSVLETIQSAQSGIIVDPDQMWEHIKGRADAFVTEHPWVIKTYDEDEVTTGTARPSKPAKKKSKKILTQEIYAEMKGKDKKEILQRFIDEAGLSKSGAATYYYNCVNADNEKDS